VSALSAVHIGLVPSLHKSAPTAQVMQTLPAVATGLPTSNCMQMGLTQQWVQQLRQLQPTCTWQGSQKSFQPNTINNYKINLNT
jgi:hypothetical protein